MQCSIDAGIVETNSYGFASDIYQCGIVLYSYLRQLPYDEISCLASQNKELQRIVTNADKSYLLINA